MSDLPEGYTLLWKTEVGSGMWGTKRNDLDLMSVYAIDTHKILRGENIRITMPHRKYREEITYGDIDVEEQSQEIGHIVNKLIDGNVNAIWSVCSPEVVEEPYSNILFDLKKITLNNLSKISYHSIKGMCMSQYNDNVKRAAVMPPGKAFRGALRVANFGITLLSKGEITFVGIDKEYMPTEEEVLDAIKKLDDSYAHSKLPEKPNENLFRDFLYHVRLGFMAE
jgi:predicted nucleotidyltransferase